MFVNALPVSSLINRVLPVFVAETEGKVIVYDTDVVLTPIIKSVEVTV